MRRRSRKRIPHVVVCVDKSQSYGRGILLGVGDFLEKNGPWSTFVEIASSGQIDRGWLRRWRGDGILAYVGSQNAADLLLRSGIPCVETYGALTETGLPRVGGNDDAIGRLGADHLLSRGLRNLAFCGPGGVEWSENRFRGFDAVAAESGCRVQAFRRLPLRHAPAVWERTQQKLAIWLERLPKPVGVMAVNDPHAVNILDACQRAGISVPDQVAVLGVANDEEFCRLSSPPLSSIISNSRRIGYEAAKMLSRLMSGHIRRPEKLKPILVPPVSVVTRQSTDLTAIEDETIATAISFIRNHACDGISVQDVARVVRRSRKTLYRGFKEVVGRSPHEEILRVQLEHAKPLLVQTSKNLDTVARMSGFTTASYFNVAFKREVGMTPGAFRNQQAWGHVGKRG